MKSRGRVIRLALLASLAAGLVAHATAQGARGGRLQPGRARLREATRWLDSGWRTAFAAA